MSQERQHSDFSLAFSTRNGPQKRNGPLLTVVRWICRSSLNINLRKMNHPTDAMADPCLLACRQIEVHDCADLDKREARAPALRHTLVHVAVKEMKAWRAALRRIRPASASHRCETRGARADHMPRCADAGPQSSVAASFSNASALSARKAFQ